jgi:hypothetical protein
VEVKGVVVKEVRDLRTMRMKMKTLLPCMCVKVQVWKTLIGRLKVNCFVCRAPGPGPLGVLSGIYGIFSGLGSLNPRRVLQSTVNFFPPDQRHTAQMALDMIFGVSGNATTLAPLTDAPLILKSTTAKPDAEGAAGLRETSEETSTVSTTVANMTVTAMKVIKPEDNNATLQEDEEGLIVGGIQGQSLESEFSETGEVLGSAVKVTPPPPSSVEVDVDAGSANVTEQAASPPDLLPSTALNSTAASETETTTTTSSQLPAEVNVIVVRTT